MNPKNEDDQKKKKQKEEDQKNHLLPKKKKELGKIKISNITETIIEEKLPPIQNVLEDQQNTKKKEKLSKDRHYYKQNRELIKQKAKNKYKERMKNREYRFNYLARQRGYNKKRKNSGVVSINKLLYPVDPFKNQESVIIIYEKP